MMSQQQDDENLPNQLTNVLLREDSRAGLPPQRQSTPVAAPAPSPQATQQATAGAAVAARWQNKYESAAQTGEIDRSCTCQASCSSLGCSGKQLDLYIEFASNVQRKDG